MTDDEQILRAVESQILDRHHVQCGLLQRNASDAITALLRCYGNVLRDLRTGVIPKGSDSAGWQTANEGFLAIAHCLRWIRSHCPRLVTVTTPPAQHILSEALELLRWGVAYAPLSNQHTAYSRRVDGKRLVEARINETDKSIIFLARETNPRFFVSQHEARKSEDVRLAQSYPDDKFSELSKSWYQSARVLQNRLRFDDRTIVSSGAIDVAVSCLNVCCLPECPDSLDLGGFSAGSLRRVLATIHVACLFRVRFEDSTDDDADAQQRVVTHVISWRRNELIQ